MNSRTKTVTLVAIATAVFGVAFASSKRDTLLEIASVLAGTPAPGSAQGPPTASPPLSPTPSLHETPTANSEAAHRRRRIQIALLLDTSSSMDGLIDQARSQLWKMVNELARAQKDGQGAELDLALFEYGNDGLAQESGFIRLVSDFTGDLDLVSEKLFALRTNGGSEFVGQVVKVAFERLAWTKDADDLRMIFVAGNEAFDQGPVNPKTALQLAARHGITVNTVYCGPGNDQIADGWRSGAALADGRFTTIDQNEVIAHIAAPQDGEIEQLSMQLNSTYVPYGKSGQQGAMRQAYQDDNALKAMAGTSTQRAIAKSGKRYRNTDWDLVDAVESNKADVASIPAQDLPEEMRGLDGQARTAYVQKKRLERENIRTRMKTLIAERDKHVAKERAKTTAKDTLDEALLGAVRTQAKRKGYVFE